MGRNEALEALEELIGHHAADHGPTEHNTVREERACRQCQRLANAQEALRALSRLTSNNYHRGG